MEATQRQVADERIARAYDLRAAMATEEGFAGYAKKLARTEDRDG